jgi:OOP family OmpA-OmpF porin
MKTIHLLRLLTVAGLVPLAGQMAMAQEGGYPYLGLSVGQSRSHFDEQRMSESVLGAGVHTTTIDRNERDTGYKLFGGYQMNRNWAFEAGYFDLGSPTFTFNTLPVGTLSGKTRMQGINLDLVGTLPITDRLSALGRVGAQYARTRDTFGTTGLATVINANPSKRETNAKIGVGLQYEFSPSFLVRTEAERYRMNDGVGHKANVDLFSLSLVMPFGRHAPVMTRVAAAPVYVAPVPVYVAPVPAPVVMLPPAPVAAAPVPRRVSFTAESLFGFDKSALRPEGKAALDTFARDVQGTQYNVIMVEGHTDRLGSNAYNQKLSLERADAVKAYLVSNARLDGARINTVGKGETMPVTKADDCKGNKASPKLIACLQPDRRVDIEVTGTR